jgi:hypothetical protein
LANVSVNQEESTGGVYFMARLAVLAASSGFLIAPTLLSYGVADPLPPPT